MNYVICVDVKYQHPVRLRFLGSGPPGFFGRGMLLLWIERMPHQRRRSPDARLQRQKGEGLEVKRDDNNDNDDNDAAGVEEAAGRPKKE